MIPVKWRSGTWRRVATLATVATLLSLLAGSGALAQGPGPATVGRAVQSAGPQGWGDEGIREVGVEWINHFEGIGWPEGDRDAWDDSCDGLYNRLVYLGWQPRFHWTEMAAWETDWKREDIGGAEDTWADSVDIAMLCTHGGGAWDSTWGNILLSSIRMGSYHADADVSPGDAYMSYGDKDLEWIAFDSCSVLADTAPFDGAAPYNVSYWAATFNGLHLMLGFKNTMYVNYPGDGRMWGFWMTGELLFFPPCSVTQSWFWAVDGVQPGVTCARVLAESLDNYSDYLWGQGYVSPDPALDIYYYIWDHCSTAKALQVKNVDQIATVPLLQVVPRQVNPRYVADIAYPLGMTGTIGMDRQFFYMVDPTRTHSLLVDTASGGFAYHDLAQLGVPPTHTLALPGFDQAMTFAERFFDGPGSDMPGVGARGLASFGYEQISAVQRPTFGEGATPAQTVAVTQTNATLTYGRSISVTAMTASGPQLAQFPIVGPGSKLIVYFGDQGQIIGMQGGTRDVQTTGQQVTIMTADEAWNLFLADPSIALAQVSVPTQVLTRTSETLGYYEQPHIGEQSELIPVWIFTADYAPGQSVEIYVPAATEYLPPQVQIDTPAPGTVVLPGQPVTFSGSVVQYGKEPFAYEWTASGDGPLGSGQSITVPLFSVIKGSGVFTQTISLDVTDANGQHGTATVDVFVRAAVYLPVIYRHAK